MDPAKDFKSFEAQAKSTLLKATKSATQLAAEDLNFHRSSNDTVAKSLDVQSARLLRLTNKLTKYVTSGSEVKAPQLRSQDDIEDNWKGVVDVIDDLLERTDACLDEFTGVIKRHSPSINTPTAEAAASKPPKFPSMFGGSTLNMPKPQLLFEKNVDNNETAPFKPLLTSKPHSLVPLEKCLGDEINGYLHPYAEEIKRSTYPRSMYEKSTPIPYKPLDRPAVFVDTSEALSSMLEDLKLAKEIAVDLEHHNIRSYVGIVCLMQISTRDQDWIVDTLKPWRLKLEALNEVFANPNILKVFHGSHMDIVWLQRDFGLYVVNLFDTFHASQTLGLPGNGLKFLLKHYCQYDAQKKYQTADWRVRPIPQDMLEYARSDTHYLLYIYDCMRNELLDAPKIDTSVDLIDEVQNKSKEFALQKYERSSYDVENGEGPEGWAGLLYKSPSHLSKEQILVFKAVHQWRDKVARLQDDGVYHVMPNNLLWSITQTMPLDQPSLHRNCRPVTPTVRTRATELIKIVKEAKKSAVNAPEQVIPSKPKRKEASSSAVFSGLSWGDSARNLIRSGKQGYENGSTKDIRASRSDFWGDTLSESSLPPADLTGAEGFDLAYSVSQIKGVSFEDHSQDIDSIHVMSTPSYPELSLTSSTHDAAGVESASEIFTVKQLGGPRKRKAEALEEHNRLPTAPVQSDEELDMIPVPKKDGRKDKKLKKKRKKELEDSEEANGQQTGRKRNYSAVPFDYENATSVLHAKSDMPHRTKEDPMFDPYKKALDAPSGMKKLRRDVPGESRSGTFHK